MLLDIVTKGSTSRSVLIRIIDSTDGTPETGVVYDTTGIDLWYRREGATKSPITEATLATTDAAYSSGGIIHIGDGYYRLDLPDAALATGANYVDVGGTVDGMIVIGGRVRLVAFDLEDTKPDVNAIAINSSTAAAARLALSAEQIIPGTVDTVTNSHTPTTTEFQADNITTAAADHYNGRIVIFTSGTLVGQATDITDYALVGGIGQFTVTALTEAPANNDTFVIV